jgi:hypothetical protein
VLVVPGLPRIARLAPVPATGTALLRIARVGGGGTSGERSRQGATQGQDGKQPQERAPGAGRSETRREAIERSRLHERGATVKRVVS